MASGATFQSPACLSLAICNAFRLGEFRLEIVDIANRELVGGHFAAGGIIDHVLADLDRLDHAGVGRCRLGLVPVAREVGGGVDDDRAAAVLDSPERMDVGREQVLGTPDRMVLGQGPELVSGSGKISVINCLNPWSNSLLPQHASANRNASLLDELAEVLLAVGRETRGPRAH